MAESTGDEVATAARWVVSRIKGDTGPGGMFFGVWPANPARISNVYEGTAPASATYPYIQLNIVPSSDIEEVGSAIVMSDMVATIKVINNDEALGPVSPINRRLHALLHGQSGTVSTGEVVSAVRESPVSYVETTDGVRFRHYGGRYRLQVQSN